MKKKTADKNRNAHPHCTAAGSMHSFFPRASGYLKLIPNNTSPLVRETNRSHPFIWTERHLKILWFDPRYRPDSLATSDGEKVLVESPGDWNLESGPDFLQATLLVGPEQRRIQGDVEVHIKPRDWLDHGHKRDPAYSRVVAHITWFSATLPPSALPAGAVQISLADAPASKRGFSFDAMDLSAYPFAAQFDRVPPCAAAMSELRHEERMYILEEAGEERLRRKAEQFAWMAETRGTEQALYEELFAALGYKHNRSAFRCLAELVPHDVLREEAGTDPLAAQAVLLGVAGLLPSTESPTWDAETASFVRRLWDRWWKTPSSFHSRRMSASKWRLSGVRPANMPHRRIAAAAALFSRKDPLPRALIEACSCAPQERLSRAVKVFQVRDPCGYWDAHATFGSQVFHTPTSLLGPGRTASILCNTVIPFLAASGIPTAQILDFIPPEDDNAIARSMAFRLFGRDHNPALLRTGLRQQGLLQIFHDFCLECRPKCSACQLPHRIRPTTTLSRASPA